MGTQPNANLGLVGAKCTCGLGVTPAKGAVHKPGCPLAAQGTAQKPGQVSNPVIKTSEAAACTCGATHKSWCSLASRRTTSSKPSLAGRVFRGVAKGAGAITAGALGASAGLAKGLIRGGYKGIKAAFESHNSPELQEMYDTLFGKTFYSAKQAISRMDSIQESLDHLTREQLEKTMGLLKGYASKNSGLLKSLGSEPEDFVQDVLVNMHRRQGLANYDPEKNPGGYESFIFSLAKNHMTDMIRKQHASTRVTSGHGKTGELPQHSSIHEPVGGDDGDDRTLGDVIPDKSGDDKIDMQSLLAKAHALKRAGHTPKSLRRSINAKYRKAGKEVPEPSRPGPIPREKVAHKGSEYVDYILSKAKK